MLKRLFSKKPKVIPLRIRQQAEFENLVLKAPLPTVVDIWSPSCAPCRKLESVLIEVATKYAGRLQVAEIGMDAAPQLLAQLGVMATPTLIVFNKGNELGRSTGFRPVAWFDGLVETEFPQSPQQPPDEA